MLLDNYWIIKDDNKELYYNLRDKIANIRSFVTDKLGYQTIITPELIKLEKLPGKAEEWMGIESFDSPMEYGFLCLLLMFLEDKGKEEQFLLSEITEYIEGTFPGDEKIDWTLYKHRRHLIKVLRLALGMGIMKLNDGDEQRFSNDYEVEVLYENTGISKYFVRHFTGNIMNYNTIEDLENDEWVSMDKDRGVIRRNRVYRRLIMSPAAYSEGVEDQDYLYIKNYKNMLETDINKYLDAQLHVHKNGAFLILDEDKYNKYAFPESKTISDITLHMCRIIVEKIKEGTLKRSENDIITISSHSFLSLVKELMEKYSSGWSKEYREMNVDNLYEEIKGYMKKFSMLEIDKRTGEINIMSLAGKIVGKYPKDFQMKEEI